MAHGLNKEGGVVKTVEFSQVTTISEFIMALD
jgi:hypothetical protein